MNKQNIAVITLSILGLYFIVAHTSPFPFSHEYFGLYEHNVHSAIGVICFVIAGVILWRGRKKK
jgi:hypothetical protein